MYAMKRVLRRPTSSIVPRARASSSARAAYRSASARMAAPSSPTARVRKGRARAARVLATEPSPTTSARRPSSTARRSAAARAPVRKPTKTMAAAMTPTGIRTRSAVTQSGTPACIMGAVAGWTARRRSCTPSRRATRTATVAAATMRTGEATARVTRRASRGRIFAITSAGRTRPSQDQRARRESTRVGKNAAWVTAPAYNTRATRSAVGRPRAGERPAAAETSTRPPPSQAAAMRRAGVAKASRTAAAEGGGASPSASASRTSPRYSGAARRTMTIDATSTADQDRATSPPNRRAEALKPDGVRSSTNGAVRAAAARMAEPGSTQATTSRTTIARGEGIAATLATVTPPSSAGYAR